MYSVNGYRHGKMTLILRALWYIAKWDFRFCLTAGKLITALCSLSCICLASGMKWHSVETRSYWRRCNVIVMTLQRCQNDVVSKMCCDEKFRCADFQEINGRKLLYILKGRVWIFRFFCWQFNPLRHDDGSVLCTQVSRIAAILYIT